MRPIIGITCDFRLGGGFSPFPWIAVGERYLLAVRELDAIPLLIPPHDKSIRDYLGMIQGLIVSGGDFDIDPALYGEKEIHPTVKVNNHRTHHEMSLLKAAMDIDLPILGICGGQQLINVVCGGTLYQHVPEEYEKADVHESSSMHPQGKSRDEQAHQVTIVPGTRLHHIVGVNDMGVNSAHHQAVRRPGTGVVVNAYATDGLIEGLEVPDLTFCVGVQWHPEFKVDPFDAKIFESLIAAARLR